MRQKRSGGRLDGLWITVMIFISGRAAVWPLLHGHRTAQDVAIFGLMLLVYLLGYAGGSRSVGRTDQIPPARLDGPAEDPRT